MADQREIFLVMIPSNIGMALGTPVRPKKILLKEKTPYCFLGHSHLPLIFTEGEKPDSLPAAK